MTWWWFVLALGARRLDVAPTTAVMSGVEDPVLAVVDGDPVVEGRRDGARRRWPVTARGLGIPSVVDGDPMPAWTGVAVDAPDGCTVLAADGRPDRRVAVRRCDGTLSVVLTVDGLEVQWRLDAPLDGAAVDGATVRARKDEAVVVLWGGRHVQTRAWAWSAASPMRWGEMWFPGLGSVPQPLEEPTLGAPERQMEGRRVGAAPVEGVAVGEALLALLVTVEQDGRRVPAVVVYPRASR